MELSDLVLEQVVAELIMAYIKQALVLLRKGGYIIYSKPLNQQRTLQSL